jgi:hypothetical protein
MAHWAELSNENVVIRVTVGDNNDPNGDEGYKWLLDNLGGTWIRTSYNADTNGFRGKFAAIGDAYDAESDLFIEPPRVVEVEATEIEVANTEIETDAT